MNIDDMGVAFPQEFLRAALLISLLSVWALVGLFYYLNRYTRREYFSIWTGAWLFYALWLTLSLGLGDAAPGSVLFTINQSCVSISAVLLLWGSLRFLGIQVPRRSAGAFAIFLAVWILVSPQMMTDSLQIHLPVFILLGLSGPFAVVCFLRLQKQKAFVGLGMLSLGFLMWVMYLGGYPFPREFENLYGASLVVTAVLQLFIAAGMIVVLFQEIRLDAQKVRAEIEAVRQEQCKVNNTKEACQSLYDQLRNAEQTEKAVAEMHRARQAVIERERLQALGQMAGDVAHDINNALSPITGYSELLLSTLPDLPDVPRERLQRISRAAENVAQIVAHMREFYRPGSTPNPPGNGNINPANDAPSLEPNSIEHCRPLRILCIDDEPQLRQLLHDVLEMDHHQVTVATGGKEGLDLFQTNLQADEPYDVVITDFGMPDIDGRDVARAIKAESPQTPIIMLTGWGTMMEADGQTTPEVDAVLGKPPRRRELSHLLCQVAGRAAH